MFVIIHKNWSIPCYKTQRCNWPLYCELLQNAIAAVTKHSSKTANKLHGHYIIHIFFPRGCHGEHMPLCTLAPHPLELQHKSNAIFWSNKKKKKKGVPIIPQTYEQSIVLRKTKKLKKFDYTYHTTFNIWHINKATQCLSLTWLNVQVTKGTS